MTETMKINIGPQHPSTHGVLRLVTELDGEDIVSVTPVIGYLHRGLEKSAESRTYLQYLPMVDRVDYLSGFFNSYAYITAVENICNIDVPKRAEYIRVLCMEMNRMTSHLLWFGTYILDLGATSPLFYSFRDREPLMSLFEELTGQRMMYNYFTFGGVRFDVTKEWLDKILKYTDEMPAKLDDYEKIITSNPIFLTRTKNKGILSKNTALKYSITGPCLRASGVNLDFRKKFGYSIYGELNFEPPVEADGDTFARYKIRIAEMRMCLSIIRQCVDYLKNNSGEISAKVNSVALKVPEGEYTTYVESPRGLLNCYVKSDGTNKPYRVKWRTGSFYLVQMLPEILKGHSMHDIMAIFGSLDVILPEVDR